MTELPGVYCGLGLSSWASQVALVVKKKSANAGDIRDPHSIPGSGRSPGGGHGNPLQYSCLENSMDRGVWQAMVHGSQRVRHNWNNLGTSLEGFTLTWVLWLTRNPQKVMWQEESEIYQWVKALWTLFLTILRGKGSSWWAVFREAEMEHLRESDWTKQKKCWESVYTLRGGQDGSIGSLY